MYFVAASRQACSYCVNHPLRFSPAATPKNILRPNASFLIRDLGSVGSHTTSGSAQRHRVLKTTYFEYLDCCYLHFALSALLQAKHQRGDLLSSNSGTHTSSPSASTPSVFFRKPLTMYLSMAGVNARASAIRNGTTSRAKVRNPAVKPKSCT